MIKIIDFQMYHMELALIIFLRSMIYMLVSSLIDFIPDKKALDIPR